MWLSGQNKLAYNIQTSTNNQYLTNYTLAQTTVDAGYGSEENYTDLEDKSITAYVKYNYFHKEQLDKKRGKINPFHPNELYYNKE